MAMKSLLILCQLGLAASLAPGDCAFVGIYGSQDDFAVVLMEDAEGEVLSLTDETPASGDFKGNRFFAAKQHVSGAKRGTVLKKSDFEHDASSLVAPSALTLFTGSATSPTVLCSIDLESKQGAVPHQDEASVVMLGPTETAQYAGSTSGSKEDLLEDIRDPRNWLHDASPRKLAGFSIAMVNATTVSTTMVNMTTVTMTVATTMTTTMTAEAARTVVSGCTVLSGSVDSLVGNADAQTAFGKAIAALASVDESYVQNVVIAAGSSCGRRLDASRRLQSGATASYDIVFPASLGALGSNAAAQQAISTLSAATPTSVTSQLTTQLAAYPALADVSVTVTSFAAPSVTESSVGGITATTTATGGQDLGGGGGSDGACPMGATFGLLVAFATSMM